MDTLFFSQMLGDYKKAGYVCEIPLSRQRFKRLVTNNLQEFFPVLFRGWLFVQVWLYDLRK